MKYIPASEVEELGKNIRSCERKPGDEYLRGWYDGREAVADRLDALLASATEVERHVHAGTETHPVPDDKLREAEKKAFIAGAEWARKDAAKVVVNPARMIFPCSIAAQDYVAALAEEEEVSK